MQIKSFTGTNTQEVIAQIKTELGPDAVILSSRSFKKGGVRCCEMTAGVDRHTNNGNGRASAPVPPGWSEWQKEWMRIKDHLYALMKPALSMEGLNPRQRVALEYLQREGVSDEVVLELYRGITARPDISILEPLETMMPVRPWSRALWPERVHILTGPFGAGKTMSALRMALLLHEREPEGKVAFINVDCVRGAGRLVLRHWAELSDFAYHEAPDAEAMRKALRSCAQADAVFVDMPGADRDGSLAAQLEALELDAGDAAAVHLCLPPYYDAVQLAAVLARYSTPTKSSLIWTKLDEAVGYACLLNVGHMSSLPVSALSYGPGLRAGFRPADASLMRRLLFKRQLPEAEVPTI